MVAVGVPEEEVDIVLLPLLWETEVICSSLAGSGWRETVVWRSWKILTRGSIMSSTSSCSRFSRPLVWTVALWRLLSRTGGSKEHEHISPPFLKGGLQFIVKGWEDRTEGTVVDVVFITGRVDKGRCSQAGGR